MAGGWLFSERFVLAVFNNADNLVEGFVAHP